MNLTSGTLQLYTELQDVIKNNGSVVKSVTQAAKPIARTVVSNSDVKKGARYSLLTMGVIGATTMDIMHANNNLHYMTLNHKPKAGDINKAYKEIYDVLGTQMKGEKLLNLEEMVTKGGGSIVAIKELEKQLANKTVGAYLTNNITSLKRDIKKLGKFNFYNAEKDRKLRIKGLRKTLRLGKRALINQFRSTEAGSGMSTMYNAFMYARKGISLIVKAEFIQLKIATTGVAVLANKIAGKKLIHYRSIWFSGTRVRNKWNKRKSAKIKKTLKWGKDTSIKTAKFAWKHTLGWTLGKIPFSNVLKRRLKNVASLVGRILKPVIRIATLPLKILISVFSIITKVFAIFSTLATGFAILCLGIMLLGVLPSLLVNGFNLNENQEKNKTALFDYVQSLYKADMAEMTGSNVNMNCSGISFIDKIDEKAYKKLNIKEKNNQSFRECTNLAEIISIVYAKNGDYIVRDDGLLKETAQYLIYKIDDLDGDGVEANIHPTDHFMDAFLLYEYTHQKSYSYTSLESVSSSNFFAEYTTYYFDEMFKLPTKGMGNGVISSKVNSTEQGIYLFFRRAGLSHEGACALMGNLWTESRWSPTADNGSHKGLAQWDYEIRYPRLINYCKNAGFSNSDDMTAQLCFVVYEMSQNYSKTFTKLLDPDVYNALAGCVMDKDTDKDLAFKPNENDKEQSVEELAGVIAEEYEGCGTQGRDSRINKANEYNTMYSSLKYTWIDYAGGSASGEAIVTKASEWIGKLHYNQNSPHRTSYPLVGNEGSDCSGLVYSMLSSEDISCPSCTASWQTNYTHALNGEDKGFQVIKPAGMLMSDVPYELQAGDLLLYRGENGFEEGTGHIAIATGDGERIHCQNADCGYGWRTLNTGEYAHCCAIGTDTIKDNSIWAGNESATVVIRMNELFGEDKTSVANGWYIPVVKITEKDTDSSETKYLFYGTEVSVANDTLDEYKDGNNSNIGILKENYRKDN